MSPEQLRALIDSTGLSISEWARTVPGVDERTVRRWLAREQIPASRADWLARATVAVRANSVVVTIAR